MSDESRSPGALRTSHSVQSSPSAIEEAEIKELAGNISPESPNQPKAANGVISDEELIDEDEGGDSDGAGLFGSASEDEDTRPKKKTLDDEDLDSGDDEGRQDRMDDGLDNEAYEQREVLTASVTLGRHGVPKGSDGELYLLRNPNFTGIEPKAFTPRSFEPPTTSHHGAMTPIQFRPSTISNTTMRWRHSPNDPAKLESNSRIIRWSDGSLTLQIGSNPMEQLELPGKALAPSQRKPITPTPISSEAFVAAYDIRQESHTYLASTHHNVGFVQLTNHITTALTVQASGREEDDALFQLQLSMIEARAKESGAETSLRTITVTEDPELAKRKAEVAEREKLRAEKRRMNQEQRQRDRVGGVGRGGFRAGYGAGLTASGLEDEMGGVRQKAKPRKPRRRGSEYSDDEGDYMRKTQEDEYDEGDGFLVGSDEEPEVMEDDEEEEEVLDDDADAEGEEDVEQELARGRSPKRPREDDDGGFDTSGAGRRRRRVLKDDDDDDDDDEE